jgi:tRNA threonylcarbamoyladenosine biosynthesis protein TsaE
MQVTRWQLRLKSARETERLGLLLGRLLHGGVVIALSGDLGTGKTTLVRGLGIGLDVPAQQVSSPSFVLIQRHHGRFPLAHADLYRLDSATEVRELGLSEYIDSNWVVAIEWAEKASTELPTERLDIHLTHQTPSTRAALILASGSGAIDLLTRLRACHGAVSKGRSTRRMRRKR